MPYPYVVVRPKYVTVFNIVSRMMVPRKGMARIVILVKSKVLHVEGKKLSAREFLASAGHVIMTATKCV